MKIYNGLINKIIFLPVVLLLFSACAGGNVSSFRNENTLLFASGNQTAGSKYRLVCCKKGCNLVLANKTGGRHVF